MAVVTRDSSSAAVGMDRASMRISYVRGLMVGARERRDKRRSFRVCSALSGGRFGVAVDRQLDHYHSQSTPSRRLKEITLMIFPCSPGKDLE